jgi:hypothetical protein
VNPTLSDAASKRLIEITPEQFGWDRIAHLTAPDGRMVYRTTHTLPVLYALSYHGWDLDVIPERDVEAIIEAAMDAGKTQEYPTGPPASFDEHLRNAADVLYQLLGPLPGGRR